MCKVFSLKTKQHNTNDAYRSSLTSFLKTLPGIVDGKFPGDAMDDGEGAVATDVRLIGVIRGSILHQSGGVQLDTRFPRKFKSGRTGSGLQIT